MNIRRDDSYFNDYNIVLQQDDIELKMCFGRNLDLYWIVRKENKFSEDYIFRITKENYFVYQAFDELYNSVKNCNVFTLNKRCETPENIEFINELNEDLKDTLIYSLIFDNGIINWHNNNEKYENGDNLEIHKKDYEYLIKFNFKNKEKNMNEICFMHSGSFCYPFNILFMNLYQKLKGYNPDYHQMNIENVAYPKKLELSNTNKNIN